MNERLCAGLGWGGSIYVADERFLEAHHSVEAGPGGFDVHRIGHRGSGFVARALERVAASSTQVPDRLMPWALLVAERALRDWGRSDPELLLSISKSDSSHIAGIRLKRRWPHVPWIAMMSDPWVDMEQFGYVQYSRATRLLNERIEAAVMNTADAIVVTNDETRALLVARYPAVASRAHVVSQCFDASIYPQRKVEQRDRVVIRYLGDFYAHRSPRPIIEAARMLEARPRIGAPRFVVELVGRVACDDAEECVRLAEGSDVVRLVGSVPYQRSIELMVDADVLLVIDAPSEKSPFLPSKLVEYIGADRPILALTPDGAAARTLRIVGGIVVDVSRPGEILRGLERVVDAWEDGRLEELRPSPAARLQFERDTVSAKFAGIAKQLAHTPQGTH
jgi:hypothetical protein